ncbi:biotin transporter BioY, partial [Prochlorococcus sp. AH-736-P10]
MLNLYKLIEILVSLQLLIITTMLPVYIELPFLNKSSNTFEMPITWQIPTIILLTLIFHKKVVFRAFSIYIIVGLFVLPVFHQGGSIGYLLTPNFGYLLGLYPLINIIDNLNNRNKINIGNFLKNGIIAIGTMHLTGIFYNFIQVIFYSQFNL